MGALVARRRRGRHRRRGMLDGAMNCDRCGATIEESAFCKYCGARVVRPSADARAGATDPARFELAAASPNLAVAMAHEPKAPVVINIVAPLFMAVFGIGFLAVATSMMGGDDMPAPAGFRVLFAAIPLAFIAICAWMVVRGVRFARAPVLKSLAVVIDERIAVSGGGKNGSVRTTYYATVQFQAGDRHEYETYDWLAGRIAAGDLGVAFTKGDRLIDFLRLEV